jgi:hypothetical protein
MTLMSPLKAVVKNGRLVLDEPTQLPDGTEIELVPVEAPPPSSVYEPVSLRDLELEPAGEEAPAPRAPARSVIARRHLSTISKLFLAHAADAEVAALVREATTCATTHLRQLENAPEGENYISNAREALAHGRQALSLLQSAAGTDPTLLPAVEEAAEAVGMIFSLLT